MKWECQENPKHNEPYPEFEEYYECSKCAAADFRLARLGVELASLHGKYAHNGDPEGKYSVWVKDCPECTKAREILRVKGGK